MKKYEFDFSDITTLISVIAVILTICGFWWATIIFIINCIVCLVYTLLYIRRINLIILQFALLALNIYFLF